MIKNFLTIFKYNIIIFLFFIGIILIIFYLLNVFLSGQPRYWEVVHNKTFENIKIEKEKIIQIKKSTSKKIDYITIFDDEYSELNYSGVFAVHKCGSIENGYHNLIYQTDRNGFRENTDLRYIFSDFVLIGDSFTQSICENKPNDLKTKLVDKTNFSFLNLGMQGTDYPIHFLILDQYTRNTNFNGLIWFFYEGNDYESISNPGDKQKWFPNAKINSSQLSDPILIPEKLDYEVNITHNISNIFKFKVWLAEYIRGFSVFLKFFKNYENLLNKEDYNKVLFNAKNYLDTKNVEKRYIVYIPSWQKLSLYKLRNINLYEKHPQIKQLNKLKLDVKEISKKNGFVFIDTEKNFFDLENPLDVFNYKLNTHFNKLGNDVLSNAVIEKIN